MKTIKDTMKELVWREYPKAVFEYGNGQEIGFYDTRWGTEIHFFPSKDCPGAKDESWDEDNGPYCCTWVSGKVRFLMPGEW